MFICINILLYFINDFVDCGYIVVSYYGIEKESGEFIYGYSVV